MIIDDRKVDIVKEAGELRFRNDLLEDLCYMFRWIVECAAAESTEYKCILTVFICDSKDGSRLVSHVFLFGLCVSCLAVWLNDGCRVLVGSNGYEVELQRCHELISSILRTSERSDPS